MAQAAANVPSVRALLLSASSAISVPAYAAAQAIPSMPACRP